MNTKSFTINSPKEADLRIKRVRKNIVSTIRTLRNLLKKNFAYDVFYSIKFEQIGIDPIESTPLNFIEQLNQSYTYLVTFKAVKYLFRKHKRIKSYKVNLGNTGGIDIEDINKGLVAECFATTNPRINQKMKKDIVRVENATAKYKYVFYYSPVKHTGSIPNGVNIIRLDIN